MWGFIRQRFRFHTGSIKRLATNERWNDSQTFRFHTGSIKSPDAPHITKCQNWFRFHTGSIKSFASLPIDSPAQLCFDSILVRLKADRECPDKFIINLFRFHTGSIKSLHMNSNMKSYKKFRFHTGSIKRIRIERDDALAAEVSIPYWFD